MSTQRRLWAIAAATALATTPILGHITPAYADEEINVPKLDSVSWERMPDDRPELRISVAELDSYGKAPNGAGSAFRGVNPETGEPGSSYLYDTRYTRDESGNAILSGRDLKSLEAEKIFLRLTDQLPEDVQLSAYCGGIGDDLTSYEKISAKAIYKRSFFSFTVPASALKKIPGQCFISNASDVENVDTQPMPGHTSVVKMVYYATGGDLPGHSLTWERRGKFNSDAQKPTSPQPLEWPIENSGKTPVSFDGTYTAKPLSPVWSLNYYYKDIVTGEQKSVEVVSAEKVAEFSRKADEKQDVSSSSSWQVYDGYIDVTEYAKRSTDCQGYFSIMLNRLPLWDPSLIELREKETGEKYPLAAEYMQLFKRDVTFPGCPATTISVDNNNGDLLYQQGVVIGDPIGEALPAAPEREGHEFVGWFDAAGNAVTAETVVAEGMALKAKWRIPATDLKPADTVTTVTVDPGNGDPAFSVEAIVGDPIGEALPAAPEREGHEFVGWFDAAGNKVTAETVVAEGMALKAKWRIPATEITPVPTPEPSQSVVPTPSTGAGSGSAQLPVTGANVALVAMLMAGLAGVGTVALRVVRRQRG